MTRYIVNKAATLLTAAFALLACTSAQFAVAQTDHYVARFNSTGGVKNSILYDTETAIGLGTTTPGSRLQVYGADNTANGGQAAIQITNEDSTNDKDWWLRVGATGTNTPDGGFSLGNDDAYWFVITFNGNVGLGFNVKNPTEALQMADTACDCGGTWTNASDRNLKENFTAIDNAQVLSKINGMTIESWNYKSEGKAVRHLGPVAQDFYSAFSLGQDDKHISTVDEGGVALAAVQELYRMVLKGKTDVANLTQANQEKDVQIENLKAEVNQLHQLQQTVQVLSTKLSKLEADSINGPTVLRASR